MKFHPFALIDGFLTYPRFLGTIKPELLSRSAAETEARLKGLSSAWWPRTLDIQKGKRILVLAPHPDDESIGCGGFLLLHKGQSSIHLVIVCDGDKGGRLESAPYDDSPEYRTQLVEERKREVHLAAQQIGIESVQRLDVPDGATEPNLILASRIRAAIDRVKPDIVLLPWFLDRHRDHRAVNVLYAWACRDLPAIVFSFEIWEMLQPNAILDITSVLDEKLELIRGYRTQTATVDYVSFSRNLAGLRGFYQSVGTRRNGAAEAYFTLPSSDYCELVCSIYGQPGALSAQGIQLLS